MDVRRFIEIVTREKEPMRPDAPKVQRVSVLLILSCRLQNTGSRCARRRIRYRLVPRSTHGRRYLPYFQHLRSCSTATADKLLFDTRADELFNRTGAIRCRTLNP
jgi:hypothetical protein